MIRQMKDGSVIATFENCYQASKTTNIDVSSISKCCKGQRKTAGGYRWERYAESKAIESTPKPIKEEIEINLPTVNKKPLMRFKTKDALKVDAYNKMDEEHSGLMAHATWSTLLSIEVMAIAYNGLIETLKEDGLYKMEIKKQANDCVDALKKYMYNIHKMCYYGDECITISKANEMYVDIFKLKLSISNYLHKFGLKYNASLSAIKVAQGMTDLIQSMHDNRKKMLKNINPNIDISDFMKPIILSSKINELAILVSSKGKDDNKIINLNDDNSIMTGVHVLDNKINSSKFVSELIIEIYEYNGKHGRKRGSQE